MPDEDSSDLTELRPPPEMAEETPQDQQKASAVPANVTFSIWPPSQRTRDAVVTRLIDTLSAPSVLSKRYGTIPPDEAATTAPIIEEEAFAAAGGSSGDANDGGIEILQIYSKEVSKRILEFVKSRTPPSAADTPAESIQSSETPADTATEEVASTVELEA